MPDNSEKAEKRMTKRLDPHLALPPPPRFDAAASAAARPVVLMPQRRFAWVYENILLAPSHWKLLVVTAIVSLTTGGVGGMLIKHGQQSLGNEPALNSVPGESQPISSPEYVEGNGGMIEPSPAEVTQSPEVQPRRPYTRSRRAPRLQVVEIVDEDSDDDDKIDRKRKKDDDDDDRGRNHADDRKRRVADQDDDDDRRRKDRKHEEDEERGQRSRRAMLYDIIRMRRP